MSKYKCKVYNLLKRIQLILAGAAIVFVNLFSSAPVNADNDASLKPTDLKVNLLDSPYGVDAKDISFSWAIQSLSGMQEAYRIVVLLRENDLEYDDYIYDSGWVESSQSASVRPYGISEILEDNQLYYWKVQIRDTFGNSGEFSEPQPFSTAVGSEWKSTAGIWGSVNQKYVFLRSNLNISDDMEKVVLSVTASSPQKTKQYVYNMYVNGTLVGMGPNVMNNGLFYYNTYDITEYLAEGENIISSVNYTEGAGAFLCQATVFYKDGTKEILMNSGSDYGAWQSLVGNEIYGAGAKSAGTTYYTAYSDNIDGTLFPYGWNNIGYDAHDWKTALPAGDFNSIGRLTPAQTDNMKRYYESVSSIKCQNDGSYLVDLGKEIVGGISLSLDIPASASIKIRYGEELNSDGSVKYQLRTGNYYEEDWKLAAGSHTLESLGMKTFRYVSILGCPVNLTDENICASAIRQEFSEDESNFYSTNSILNEIYNFTKYSVKATNQNLYVDCQNRERNVYEGDSYINMLSSYAFEDDYSLARISLDYCVNNETWPAEYPLYTIMAAWEDYMYTGDISFLERNYTVLKNKLYDSCFNGRYGLVKNPNKTLLIDWPVNERDGYDENGSYYNTVFNSVCAGAYETMADISEVLEKYQDEAFYRQRASLICQNMISKLYDKNNNRLYDGMSSDGKVRFNQAQHATAYALAYGVYDSQTMADNMAKAIEKDGKIKMSVYGAFTLINGLYDSNNGLLARKMLSNPNYKKDTHTWAYMMYGQNATITAEAWSSNIKSNISMAHPWGSSPAGHITRGMFGIEPLEAGFSKFQVKLQPGGVKEASVTVPTLKGLINVHYQMTGSGSMITELNIPGNTTARILIPADNSSNDKILINGLETQTERYNGYFAVELGSGSYEIISESGIYEDPSEIVYREPSADVRYRTHIQTYGWETVWKKNGQMSGTTGQAKRLEGIEIQLESDNISGGVEYRTHVQTYGWEADWKKNGQMSGTTGQAKRLEAIQIRLTGEAAMIYDIYYRVHSQTYGWLGWAKNGESAGTEGFAKRLEGIEILLVKKGAAAPGSRENAFIDKKVNIMYNTHVQTYGWQNWVSNGALSGTTGQAKRLEAIQIKMDNTSIGGSINYRTHVQTYGWLPWTSNGALSGTTGQAKRLEAIQITLGGEMAERYDVYYRVHAQTFGWLGWAKNGQPAGSAGYAKRLEGIEIVLVKKGNAAPGSMENAFYSK